MGKKVFILGGTGFIGSYLIPSFLNLNYEVYLLTRNLKKAQKFSSVIRVIEGDPLKWGDWIEIAKNVDIAINLVGQNIFGRWTQSYKKLIWESRIKSTENIVKALSPGTMLINASAIGYYGNRGEDIITEESSSGKDFFSKLCKEWEKRALSGKEKNLKVAVLRLGMVLGKGGMLAKFLPFFKLGLGGMIGKGKQWISWIHIEDVVRAIIFLIQNSYEGIYNLVSPNPVTNEQFIKTLASILNRPVFLRIPDFILKPAMGELSQLLLSSIRVYPQNLLKMNFNFKFPYLEKALRNLF